MDSNSSAIRRQNSSRVLSVDVLRGIVMFTMVFVNDAYGASGSPWWLMHWSDLRERGFGPSGMTFVDVVFPAFLFIMGMSIPLAIENRRAGGSSWLSIIGHVLVRTLSLVFLGVLMVNEPSAKSMGWPDGLWNMLLVVGALVGFHSLPLKHQRARQVSLALRIVGIGLLAFLAFKFRSKNSGGLEHSWWGILGLIGLAYFGATVVYLLLRKEGIGALVAAVALLMSVYFADSAHTFRALQAWRLPLFGHKYQVGSWLLPIGETFGSQTAISMMGVVIGSILLPGAAMVSPRAKIRFAAVFAALMCVGALLLHKTFGISKNNATPSWCLWSAAITTGLWLVLFLIIDVGGWRMWSIPIAWAGASALMIYILAEGWDIFHEHFKFLQWNWYDNLEDRYPQSLYHKAITAAAISLFAGVIGRLGLKLRL